MNAILPLDVVRFFAAALLCSAAGAVSGQTPPPPPRSAAPASVDLAAAELHLSQAIQIRTVSHDENETADPATLEAFRAFLTRTYPEAHRAMTRQVMDHQALLYTWPGLDPTAKPIILIAHMDVVPAEEQGDAPWRVPAFSGAIRDDAIWGRGAIDMKGQLISLFEAIEALVKAGYKPQRTIYVGIGSNEETFGTGAQAIASALAAKGVHADFILDEGPVIIDPFELTKKRAGFIGVAEKGYGVLQVTAADAGGHSAVPPLDPALERLGRAIVAIDHLPVRRALDPTDLAMLKSLSGDMVGIQRFAVDNLWLFRPLVTSQLNRIPAGRALLGTTIAPTMASGSTKENTLPAVATARLNVRLHPRDKPAAILAEARKAVSHLRDVSVDWNAPPVTATRVAALDSRAYGLLTADIRHMGGKAIPVAPVLVFGGTDSRYYADVADNAYLFQPYILSEPDLDSIHGRDEHLSIDNLGRAIGFFYAFIPAAAAP